MQSICSKFSLFFSHFFAPVCSSNNSVNNSSTEASCFQGMEAGDVAGPVQTQFGWHLIKLNETRIAETPTLDEVRDQIRSELEAQAIEDHVTALTEAAEIERPDISGVDPSVLQQLDLLD